MSLPQLNEVTNGVYESMNDNKSSGQPNNNMAKQGTPPGKAEKGQKDANEKEKKNRALSSFQNPAYQSTSMGSGLDVQYGVIPASGAHDDDDTAL